MPWLDRSVWLAWWVGVLGVVGVVGVLGVEGELGVVGPLCVGVGPLEVPPPQPVRKSTRPSE